MKVTSALLAQERRNPHGASAKPIYDSPHAAVVHVSLQPGQLLKKHSTPVDVFFYVLEGDGIVEIGDEKERVSRDRLIESPARVPHGLSNNGDKPFRFLVVKVPRQAEATKVL